jgi:hypothetical protein
MPAPSSSSRSTSSVLGLARPLLRPLLLGALTLVAAGSCARGDVGAPCNHGDVEPPESKLVTFPALSCNDLLCVYADEEEPPAAPCGDDLDCNVDASSTKFECVKDDPNEPGECGLRIDYVLERSMCSVKCSSDADCADGGVGERVVADNTQCSTGFSCARIQTLGKFCCEKICVCNDDLGDTTDINSKCSSSTQEGCCDQMPVPEACGKP